MELSLIAIFFSRDSSFSHPPVKLLTPPECRKVFEIFMGKRRVFSRLFFGFPSPDTFPGRQETGGKEGRRDTCPAVLPVSQARGRKPLFFWKFFLEGDQERDLTDFESGAADAPLPPPPSIRRPILTPFLGSCSDR